MPQVGDVLEDLDGAELILSALAPVDETPIRAEDGVQLELVIDLSGFERLQGGRSWTRDCVQAR